MSTVRLPLSLKILYSFGQFGVNIPTYFILAYIFVAYKPLHSSTVYLSPYFVGVAFAVGVIVQAIANPFIGHVSDKLNWKMGRRRPFLLIGAVPLAFTFALLFFPPSLNQTVNFVYLFIDFALFNFLYTFVVLPYLAMIPEISVTSMDRIRLLTISAYFTIISTILSLVIAGMLLSAGFGIFKAALVMALIIGVSFYIPFFFIRSERFKTLSPQSYSIAKAIITTFKNKTFNIYLVSYVFLIFGVYAFLASLTYYVGIIIFPGSKESVYESYAALFEAFVFIVVALASLLMIYFSDRYGKKRAMITFALILGVGLMLLSLPNGKFAVYELILILVITGIGATAPMILPYAVLSDIIDEDETLTGFRREGMYFGMQGLIERIPYSISGLFIGWWMSLYFITQDVMMVRIIPVIAGIMVIITAVIFTKVPLKEKLKG